MNTEQKLLALSDSKEIMSPWDQQIGEPDNAYDAFRKYLHLGPHRTIKEAYRQSLMQAGKILPGQPLRMAITVASAWSIKYSWKLRTRAWDEKNWQAELEAIDEARRNALHEMVERHIEGWQVISEASIANFYVRDENNEVVMVDGQPKVRVIEDEGVALRAYRQAVAGERTARGLPAELIVMSTQDIKQRIVDINQKLVSLQSEDDILDGEYEELDGDEDEE